MLRNITKHLAVLPHKQGRTEKKGAANPVCWWKVMQASVFVIKFFKTGSIFMVIFVGILFGISYHGYNWDRWCNDIDRRVFRRSQFVYIQNWKTCR